ncbi:hypothetical protein [Micromonospora sp. NPDC049679]|uniref:hypothetical protein n=1 Tax=Micromonospora sp. NPDC049679 TaxID=3155920 RepID=UPI003401F275
MPRSPVPRSAATIATVVIATIVIATALMTIGSTAPAGAADREPGSPRTRAYLATHPGGAAINDNQVSYGDGALIVTLARPAGTRAAADCPSGWFCFYDRVNFGYPRGQLNSCGWQDLAWWSWHDLTESVHYNISTGSVTFLNHATGTSHGNDQPLFSASSGNRTLDDVAPNRNRADHVYRYC